MFKQHYKRFINAHPDELHFTAHSHHFWPDVTRDAIIKYWDDSAKYADDKWPWIAENVFYPTQELIANFIGSNTPEQIVFGTNTHEFIYRLISCIPKDSLSVLTSDSEFHSFNRQISRISEDFDVHVTRVSVENHSHDDTFNQAFIHALKNDHFNLIFISQVFFNSGRAILDLEDLMQSIIKYADKDAIIILDGYHGFCALPTNISAFSHRIFYTAGGYKYAQAGEGACFLHSPPGCTLRPINTGWFASFTELSANQSCKVTYANNGNRFAGATFDPSGVYRLRSVLELFKNINLDTEKIHCYISELQDYFISLLQSEKHSLFSYNKLFYTPHKLHGHFLTFLFSSEDIAFSICKRLKSINIYTDCRGNRLRIGFGLWHDRNDINEFFKRLKTL